ncbi:MAG TPA: hypothetical protein VF200_09900 [Woeseiaceae bacterium]
MQQRIALILIAVTGMAGLPSRVHAETTARVLAMHPAGESVTLALNQTFYVRIAYTTDAPVRIWARPYYQGVEVRAGSNPSRVYTGSGEALGWFFLMEPGQRVDEIRISVGDGSRSGTRVTATRPVHIASGNARATSAAEPEWVAALKKENERLQREERAKQASTPPSAGEMLFMSGFMLTVAALGIVGILAPVWALRRWRGGWRVAAAVPAAMMTFVVLRIVLGTALDPTSHNLWPFEILQVGVLSLAVIGVLLAARKLTGAQA